MPGGLFAINCEFFRKIGTYDSGFDVWGGENLELSFKTWMCGGTLETIPCSRVGHVFRKTSPYAGEVSNNVLNRNLIRLATVWLDEYKEYYFRRTNNESRFVSYDITCKSISKGKGKMKTNMHDL